jgi:hypothetical protein
MIATLHLTVAERQFFDALPDGLKEGWVLGEENLSYADDPRHRTMRMQLMHLHDPKMQEFLEQAKAKAGDDQSLAAFISETDLSDVSDGDLAELFFVLGPGPLGVLIPSLLKEVSTDEHLEDIASLTLIRHTLLTSMHHS